MLQEVWPEEKKNAKKKLKILNKLAPLKLVCDPPTDTGQKKRERKSTVSDVAPVSSN